MSLGVGVAIAAAERVERTGGPSAGLAVWRRLAESATSAELRGRACLATIRCATTLRDLGSIRDVCRLWETVDAGVWDTEIARACRDMARGGLLVTATELAFAEVRRHPTARALYTYARCLDVAGDRRAGAAFADAAARAAREGVTGMEAEARLRRAAWLSADPEQAGAALADAKAIDPASLTPPSRLALASILLRAPSRFQRASAIGLLDALATGEDSTLAARAVSLAARHADDLAEGLSPMELDRLLALFGREPVRKLAPGAQEALRLASLVSRAEGDDLAAALDQVGTFEPRYRALVARARDVVRGRFEPVRVGPTEPPVDEVGRWSAVLDAAVALRDGAHPRASIAIRSLAELAEAGERLPAAAWTVATVALERDDAELAAVAGRLAFAMLRSATHRAPRGFLRLAVALAARGMDEVANLARRAAVQASEPNAEDALALSLTRSGWQLARKKDRRAALARLREARALWRSRSSG